MLGQSVRVGYSQAELTDQSLGAFELAQTGELRRAGRELAALGGACLDRAESCNLLTPHIAVQRLAAAQWLGESGEPEQARRLLRWQDAEATYTPPLLYAPGVQSLACQSYGLSVLGAVLGTVQPERVEERREAVVAHINQLSNENDKQFSRAWLAWLDGMLAFARGAQQAINTARRQARATGWFQADLVDRSLAAFGHALQGNRWRAGRELAELEEYCVTHRECVSIVPHTAVQRLFAGQWLLEAGELQAARRLLQWQPWSSVGWSWTTGDALAALRSLTRARVEEALGSNDAARFYYEQFLRRYDQPVPSQAHLITEAKAALARLGPDT